MAYKKMVPRIHVDVPDEELDPRVLKGLKYFEALHEADRSKNSPDWSIVRPRMIRVLNDAYRLKNQNVTYFPNA